MVSLEKKPLKSIRCRMEIQQAMGPDDSHLDMYGCDCGLPSKENSIKSTKC